MGACKHRRPVGLLCHECADGRQWCVWRGTACKGQQDISARSMPFDVFVTCTGVGSAWTAMMGRQCCLLSAGRLSTTLGRRPCAPTAPAARPAAGTAGGDLPSSAGRPPGLHTLAVANRGCSICVRGYLAGHMGCTGSLAHRRIVGPLHRRIPPTSASAGTQRVTCFFCALRSHQADASPRPGPAPWRRTTMS